MLSIRRLRRRKKRQPFVAGRYWLMDSGGFTEISKYGKWTVSPETYAEEILYWEYSSPVLVGAMSQDYPCDPSSLASTGLDVSNHQRLTIDRYDAVLSALQRYTDVPLLVPVIQGWEPKDYAAHLRAYGKERLEAAPMMAIGSLVTRSTNLEVVESVLSAIRSTQREMGLGHKPLHGLGLKLSTFQSAEVVLSIDSADSMAWAFHARKQKLNHNYPGHAAAYIQRVNLVLQKHLINPPPWPKDGNFEDAIESTMELMGYESLDELADYNPDVLEMTPAELYRFCQSQYARSTYALDDWAIHEENDAFSHEFEKRQRNREFMQEVPACFLDLPNYDPWRNPVRADLEHSPLMTQTQRVINSLQDLKKDKEWLQAPRVKVKRKKRRDRPISTQKPRTKPAPEGQLSLF